MQAGKENRMSQDSILYYCNLKTEYALHIDAYTDVIRKTLLEADLCDGAAVKRFEQAFAQYCGAPFCSAVDSGTSALFLAMKALGIGKGDEVIVPANTFTATALAALYAGATPVFCDCKADTWEIDPQSAAEKITPKTKAVAGVHLYGQPCDMDALQALAHANDLLVIEDCAQSCGAACCGKSVGTLSDAGCFSFYPTKTLGAAGAAGCVLTARDDVKAAVDSLKFYAWNRESGDFSSIGYNMRMDSIQAALLEYKLSLLAGANARREEIAQQYLAHIRNPRIRMQAGEENCERVWHIFCACVENRKAFLLHMRARNIVCGIHYPVPCHLQSAYRHLGYKKGDLPHSEALAAQCVSLPLYPEMSQQDVERVIDACNLYC